MDVMIDRGWFVCTRLGAKQQRKLNEPKNKKVQSNLQVVSNLKAASFLYTRQTVTKDMLQR